MKSQRKNNDGNGCFGGNVDSLVKTLLNGFSIEITTNEAHRITDFQALLPLGTEVYIVATPTTQPNDVIQLGFFQQPARSFWVIFKMAV